MGTAQAGQTDTEQVVFPPPPSFSEQAGVCSMQQYQQMWDDAADDPEGFWGRLAKEELYWFHPFDKVLEWNEPYAKWFTEGKTNVSYNCLDVHLDSWRKNKAALIWEGEPGDTRTLTYAQLHREVCKFSNVLKALGVEQGDVVSIYMPMVPELAIALLACARIGAIHSVVFGGFSSEAIAERNNDASAKILLTADTGWRRGSQLPLKETVDKALEKSPTVEKCIVYRRTGSEVNMVAGRDLWWHDLMESASPDCPAEPLESETPLFILYTSGSTGKPKGIKHTTAGYNLYAKMTSRWVFDLKDTDVYWCTADIGWITGHSYIVYGPLSNGVTAVMYEGAPNWPDESRFWDIVDRHQVTIFYTAPTAIRAFIKWGDQHVEKHDLSSLRLLGTVGEPINPAAWMWYHEKIGKRRCPIVDTWWQTETGGIMMSPLPGATPTKPGSCTRPLPGIIPQIVDEKGNELGTGQQGILVITKPWPGMLRGIWGDDDRYKQQYWSTIAHNYLAGDNAMCDADGYYWIYGRLDDVLNVAGHRLSTTEVESALVSHPSVAEAAVVGRPDDVKGEAVAAFVTLSSGDANEDLRKQLKQHVRQQIGAHAQPDDVRFAALLPKTRSGKIMRRLLRDIAAGKETIGDTTTLEDYSVLASLRSDEE
ncbi:MAG: acetate--CoA ligase [Planctomycetales bacterium]|nr:acetate--CoA ligase [Planctomycetales bacterium]NIM08080.1 acetate--CoA ligase [Planctomycetales bacterium]NIN07571.1 acetate--CoA ligase [Planctomycetales bacterium]NIN76682.1 acetate--CoA ligase [Planctomycetales bacterium]NIO33870.1 acetate--CoA ligase [Planctomycetales bacterium]